jgi:hypothetical protein
LTTPRPKTTKTLESSDVDDDAGSDLDERDESEPGENPDFYEPDYEPTDGSNDEPDEPPESPDDDGPTKPSIDPSDDDGDELGQPETPYFSPFDNKTEVVEKNSTELETNENFRCF